MLAGRVQREGHVVGRADDHLVDKQLGRRAGLINTPFDQRPSAADVRVGGRAGGRLRRGLLRGVWLRGSRRRIGECQAAQRVRQRGENRGVSWEILSRTRGCYWQAAGGTLVGAFGGRAAAV